MAHSPWYLYRAFDSEGMLLYVGSAKNFRARMRSHKSRSPWYPAVEITIAEKFKKKSACYAAERKAIATEAPLFNRHRPNRMNYANAVSTYHIVATEWFACGGCWNGR